MAVLSFTTKNADAAASATKNQCMCPIDALCSWLDSTPQSRQSVRYSLSAQKSLSPQLSSAASPFPSDMTLRRSPVPGTDVCRASIITTIYLVAVYHRLRKMSTGKTFQCPHRPNPHNPVGNAAPGVPPIRTPLSLRAPKGRGNLKNKCYK